MTDASVRRMRLEVLVSFMPTKKCRALVAIFEDLVRRWPDELRLDVYEAGSEPRVKVTRGYAAADKRKKVPCAFVNGRQVADGDVPDALLVEARIREELSRGSESWEE